jgi:hypothetical protein
MAFAERVVHLRDDRTERARGVVRVVEADRIEDVAEQPTLREQKEGAAAKIDPARAEAVLDLVARSPAEPVQVIGIMEGKDAAPIHPEEQQPPTERLELVEVEPEIGRRVAESVPRWPHAMVRELTPEEAGLHAAARLSSSERTTSRADTTPSS